MKAADARRSSTPSSRPPSSTVSIRKPTWRTQSTAWPRAIRSTGSPSFCRGTGKPPRPPSNRSSAPPDPSRDRHDAYRLTLTSSDQTRPAKRRKPAVRQPLPEHLPRETVELAPEIACSCCQPELTRIGEDVTEVLETIPAQLKVI